MKAMATARKLLLGKPLHPSSSHPKGTHSSSHSSGSKPEDSKKFPTFCFEVLPGKLFGDTEKEDNFKKYAQNCMSTYYHVCGTCSMQTGRCPSARGTEISECECSDCLAVVDAELKVLGVRNLRVADASVFPRIPSGPTSATCMAVGVGLGRLILEEKRGVSSV